MIFSAASRYREAQFWRKNPRMEGKVMFVEAEHLKLTIKSTSILNDVNLHLAGGKIYGLLGPNGAGKSTTIAVILGLYDTDGGTLKLFDEPAGKHSMEAIQRIGVMPERAGFYDWMSAREYLEWYAELYGGIQFPISDLLDQVGLKHVSNSPVGHFSRGMRQRLALARALSHNPDLLILDEPTSGLDPRGRREIHDLLLSLAREKGTGILLSTHLLDDVDRLCDFIGIIHKGQTVLEGSSNELLNTPGSGHKFRLRLRNIPNADTLPNGVHLTGRKGNWWHVSLSSGINPPLLWRALLKSGWQISEIHGEGNGLEELYFQMTSERGNTFGEELL